MITAKNRKLVKIGRGTYVSVPNKKLRETDLQTGDEVDITVKRSTTKKGESNENE